MRPTLEFIRNSNLIENIDSAKEDRQSWRTWEWLIEQDHISEPTLLELHARITRFNLSKKHRGNYRNVQVYVGNHVPPGPEIAKYQAYDWLMDLLQHWQTLDPKEMHIRFETIHPFIDGNGRAGRMLMWWHQVKLGQPATMISFDNRPAYYAWFNRKGQ